MKVRKIEILFPVEIELLPGWDRALDSLVSMLCETYEMQHPTRSMWTAGHGNPPVWREPEEPTFDTSVYCIDVAEREANERELKRRTRKAMP